MGCPGPSPARSVGLDPVSPLLMLRGGQPQAAVHLPILDVGTRSRERRRQQHGLGLSQSLQGTNQPLSSSLSVERGEGYPGSGWRL